MPQGFCKKTEMYNSSVDNLANVADKFNQLKKEIEVFGKTKLKTSVKYRDLLVYDKVLTYNGKVVYSYGYTNDFIYCIKWGQSIGEIDNGNYYTPEPNCSGRWKNMMAYFLCKEK